MWFLSSAVGWVIGWAIGGAIGSSWKNVEHHSTTIVHDYSKLAKAMEWVAKATESVADSNRNITIPMSERDKIQHDFDSYHNIFKEWKKRLSLALKNLAYIEYEFGIAITDELLEDIVEYFLRIDSIDIEYERNRRSVWRATRTNYKLYLLLFERNKPDDCQTYLSEKEARYMRIALMTDKMMYDLQWTHSIGDFIPLITQSI